MPNQILKFADKVRKLIICLRNYSSAFVKFDAILQYAHCTRVLYQVCTYFKVSLGYLHAKLLSTIFLQCIW